jgi:hypothetical protein
MTFVLILPLWLILLVLVAGLCTAARVGDRLNTLEIASEGGPGTEGLEAEETTPLSRPGGVRSATGTRGRASAGNVAA